jgi:hypothetical protein
LTGRSGSSSPNKRGLFELPEALRRIEARELLVA